MNRILFLIVVLFTTVAISCNQSRNQNDQSNYGPGSGTDRGNFDPEQMVDRQMEQMKDQLDLTGDQETQMRKILKEGAETMQKARIEMRESGGGFEGMREQMQQMREEQNEKVKAILSDEQWEKYEQIQQEMRERRREGGFGKPN